MLTGLKSVVGLGLGGKSNQTSENFRPEKLHIESLSASSKKLFWLSLTLYLSPFLGGIIAKMESQNLNKNADINEILINFWPELHCNNETFEILKG